MPVVHRGQVTLIVRLRFSTVQLASRRRIQAQQPVDEKFNSRPVRSTCLAELRTVAKLAYRRVTRKAGIFGCRPFRFYRVL